MAVEAPRAPACRNRVPAGACCGAIEGAVSGAISGTISAVSGAAIAGALWRVAGGLRARYSGPKQVIILAHSWL